MRFSYYQRLTRARQAVYRRSDEIHAVRLGPDQAPLVLLARAVEQALGAGEQPAIEAASVALTNALTDRLRVPRVVVRVLPVRPRDEGAELHGLYVAHDGRRPIIRVWMRTAQHRRVVAFKGFFKRESSLFHQLVPRAPE